MLTVLYYSSLPLRRCVVTLLLCFSMFTTVKAGEEPPYMNELKGTQLTETNHFTVTDDKFKSLALWNTIQQNISVDNILSFEINFDTSYYK
jgi:hypothetical protein